MEIHVNDEFHMNELRGGGGGGQSVKNDIIFGGRHIESIKVGRR